MRWMARLIPILVAVWSVAPTVPAGAKEFSVLDYGAIADGKTDCTAAFQRAMDAATTAGATVVSVPEGVYLFKGHLTVTNSVALVGSWQVPPMDHYRKIRGFTKDNFVGSVLLATQGKGHAHGHPFITLMNNSTLKGLTIFYPDQTKTNPPLAYPWTVASGGADNCSIVDCLLLNPYQAVDFGSKAAGRHYIEGLYGQPLYRGIYVDNCFDVGRIQNVHFWPFWCNDPPIRQFMGTKGVAFIFGRADWEFVSNSFCIEYHVGYHFIAGRQGPGNVLMTQSGSDVGPYAVIVDGSQAHAGHSFENCQFYGALMVNENNTGPIKFTGCGFFGSDDGNHGVSQGVIKGNGQVTFSNCTFITIDPKNTQHRVFEVDSGGVTFNGCDFMDAGKEQVYLGPNVRTAILVANRFVGKMNIDNESKGNVQIGLNADDMRKEEPGAIVVDDSASDGSVTIDPGWNRGFTGTDYLGGMHWIAAGNGDKKVTWTPNLPAAGEYEVYVWFGADNNNDRATNAPFTVNYLGGSKTFRVNLKQNTGTWYRLGEFPFEKGRKGSVVLTNQADGYLAADAVKFVKKVTAEKREK